MRKRKFRITTIADMLKENPALTVADLSGQLKVSEMTIRRDLRQLGEANHAPARNSALRLVGRLPEEDGEYSIPTEGTKQYHEKDRIGRFAATLIEPGDVLIVDTGTTTERFAKYFPENENITVLCYNFNIMAELHRKKGIQLLLSGGYYHPSTQTFECDKGIEFIRGIRAKKFFMAASGVHETLGLTCARNYEIATKQAAIASSQTRILLVDSTKFGNVRAAYFAQLADVDVIITDSGLGEEWRERIREAGIRLHVV